MFILELEVKPSSPMDVTVALGFVILYNFHTLMSMQEEVAEWMVP